MSEKAIELSQAIINDNEAHISSLLADSDIKQWINNTINPKRLKGFETSAETTLCLAIAFDISTLDTCKKLVNRGANVKTVDSNGSSMMIFAAKAHNERIQKIEYLKESGLDTDHVDKYGRTALMKACLKGYMDSVDILIKHGEDVNRLDAIGCNCLHYALFGGHENIMNYLIDDKHLDPLALTKHGLTCLHAAARGGSVNCVQRMLDLGIRVDVKDDSHETPLMHALLKRSVDVADLLIYKGAYIKATNVNGDTCLHAAVHGGSIECVKQMLESGIDVDIRVNSFRNTPLIVSLVLGHSDIVNLLLKKGADVDATNKNGFTCLHAAAQGGSIECVKQMLEFGIDVDVREDSLRNTPLIVALLNGHSDISNLLLKKGANVNATNKNGFTCLHAAAQGGSIECVKQMLEFGIDVDVREGALRNTPLIVALVNGHSDISNLLLEKGANVNATNKNGCTCLHAAAGGGSIECVNQMLKLGIDVDARDDTSSNTPLIAALENGHSEIAKLLLKKGAYANATNMNGYTCLHVAAHGGSIECVEQLLKSGIDVDARSDGFRNTPLLIASFKGHSDIANLLFKKGADVNATNKIGCTCLHAAAQGGSIECVKQILEFGIDVDVREDEYNNTSLIEALLKGHSEIANILLNKGADVNATNKNGTTCLQAAVQGQSIECVKKMLEFGIDVDVCTDTLRNTPLIEALLKGHGEIANLLVKKGADVYATNKNRFTCLHAAAQGGSIECVKQMLEFGINIDVRDNELDTPLMNALLEGHFKVVELLIEQGANVYVNDKNGFTCLHAAARGGSIECVKQMLEFGINIDVRDNELDTPLMNALLEGHFKVVELLIEQGANVYVNDKNGFTCLHAAARGGSIECVKLMLKYGIDIDVREDQLMNTPLIQALCKGHSEIANLLLKEGADGNVTNKNGCTCLHAAAYGGSIESVKQMLEFGIDVDAGDKLKDTSLMVALEEGHSGIADSLIKKGADVNAANKDGFVCLHHAAQGGSVASVKQLIDHGIDVNVQNKRMVTPLITASYKGNADVINILVDNSADVNAKTVTGVTALHSAAENGHNVCVKLLLKNNAKLDICTTDGSNALSFAIQNNHMDTFRLLIQHELDSDPDNRNMQLICAAANGCSEIAIDLIQKGADVNAFNSNNINSFQAAIVCDQVEMVELLILSGADVNAQKGGDMAPLHLAARQNNASLVKGLLNKGADVDLNYREKKTSLHITSCYGYIDVMKVLLENGATIDAQTIDGWTPLIYAVTGNHKECVLELLNRKAETTFQTNTDGSSVFHIAAKRGFTEVLGMLLQHRNSIGVGDFDGRLPLHVAAEEGHVECIKILLGHNAKVEVRDKDDWTPLMSAAYFGHTATVEELLQKRANINAFNFKKSTALHLASQEGFLAIVKMLIDYKAEVDCYNKASYTPLHVAIQENHVEIVTLLIQNGASPVKCTHVGNSALHIASFQDHLDLIKILFEIEAVDINARRNDGDAPIDAAFDEEKWEAVLLIAQHPKWDQRVTDRMRLRLDSFCNGTGTQQSIYELMNKILSSTAHESASASSISDESLSKVKMDLVSENSVATEDLGQKDPQKSQIVELQDKINDLQYQLGRLDANSFDKQKKIQNQIADYEHEKLDLENKVRRLEKENQEIKTGQKEMQNALTKLSNEIIKIKKENLEYQQTMEIQRTQLIQIIATFTHASDRPVVKTPLERAIQKNYTSLTKSVEPDLIVGRVFELDLIDNDQLEEIQLKGAKKRQMEELLRILMRSPDPKWAKLFVDVLKGAEKYGNIVECIELAEKEITIA